jgi:hypothetical protein
VRGSIGLVIGVALGAGAMYLVLRPPWESRPATVPSEGPPVVVVRDAGVTKPGRKKRRPRATGQTPAPGTEADTEHGEGELDEPDLPVLTAADRALEWRGDDVTLPPRTVDMTGGGEARPLEDGEINATLNAQAGPVKDCVVQGAINTDLRAAITLKLVVDGRGRVVKSRIHAPRYLLEHGLLGCAQRAVARMRFPATGAATLVTVPVNLG